MADEKPPRPIAFPKQEPEPEKPETIGFAFKLPEPGGNQPKKKGPRRIDDPRGR